MQRTDENWAVHQVRVTLRDVLAALRAPESGGRVPTERQLESERRGRVHMTHDEHEAVRSAHETVRAGEIRPPTAAATRGWRRFHAIANRRFRTSDDSAPDHAVLAHDGDVPSSRCDTQVMYVPPEAVVVFRVRRHGETDGV